MNTRRLLTSAGLPLVVGGCLLLMSASPDDPVLQPRLGEPMPGLTAAELQAFTEGAVAFGAQLTIAQGLGPIMNDEACGNCHSQPVLGGSSVRTVTRFGIAATGGNPFNDMAGRGGSLLQEQSIDEVHCLEIVPAAATVTAERATPMCFGMGLVEAIPESDFLANEASQPSGFNGFIYWVDPLEGAPAPIPGRFSWKGGMATTLSFSGGAGLNEMGLTNRLIPVENAPNGDQAALAACDTVADPEDGPDASGKHMIDRWTDFQRYLAGPPQTPKSGMSGALIFESVGCAVCHRSSPYTSDVVAEAALSGQVFTPYSDFLVHDMGTLGDGFVDGPATETMFQSRALWGLVQRSQAFLHDARATGGTFAQNIDFAILEHDGEAIPSRVAYSSLSAADKEALIIFLGSLGRPEFDVEGGGGLPGVDLVVVPDNDVDEFDWFYLEIDFSGPLPTFTPDDPAAIGDVDQDGDMDLLDFGMFQRAFTGNI